MGFFKKKEKPEPCTSNVLCVHLTEDTLRELAQNLYDAFLRRDKGITKKRVKILNDEFEKLKKEFSHEISVEFPWIKRWTLIRRTTNVENYYLNVERHNISEVGGSIEGGEK